MPLPDGWLDPNEADELRRLSVGMNVLELGAWKGRSTVVLAEGANYVVSVDRHKGTEGFGATGVDSLPDYLGHVRELENVAIVVAEFRQVMPFLGFHFDLVYVDGEHDWMSAMRDTQYAVEHCGEGGTIALHDWDMESVRRGVAHIFPTATPTVVGSVASFRL